MRLLLDTHVALCQLSGERELSDAARRAIATADDLLFSVVSFAEIGGNVAVGKLTVPDDRPALLSDAGVRTLKLTAAHGLEVGKLPVHHRDPFDRLLIAQAVAERLSIVTADVRFNEYDVPVVPA